jgi:hypothetical protein
MGEALGREADDLWSGGLLRGRGRKNRHATESNQQRSSRGEHCDHNLAESRAEVPILRA